MLDTTYAYDLTFLFPARDMAVGACLRDFGEFARTELDFFLEHADGPHGTYVDVGANIGALALPFAAQRRDWKVVAVEAHRGLAGVLNANALINRLYNVDVFHAAAGGASGLAEFPAPSLDETTNFGNLGFGRPSEALEPVRMARLDTLAPADTRLIKIDVEGFEPKVLEGAPDLLAAHRAIWLVEAARNNPKARGEVIRAFQAARYAVHWFFAPFATLASAKRTPANAGVGDVNVVALPPGTENRWSLPQVGQPEEEPPVHADAFPYLARYGY